MHPCQQCPARAFGGHVACPEIGKVINRGRCDRIRWMPPDKAMVALVTAWDAGAFDKAAPARQRRWLTWIKTNPYRVRDYLSTLSPREQIRNWGPEVLVIRKRRALGGDASGDGLAAIGFIHQNGHLAGDAGTMPVVTATAAATG